MEKSSEVVLSKAERDLILGRDKMTKKASSASQVIPERMEGWYSHSELKDIANEQD